MLKRVFTLGHIVATYMTAGQTDARALPAVTGLHAFLTPQRPAFEVVAYHVEVLTHSHHRYNTSASPLQVLLIG